LKEADAFCKSFLLKSNGAQDRTSYRTSFRIGKSQPRLPLCLLQPPLLGQANGFLESLARISSQNSGGTQKQKPAQ
jgi:hypothetical protein